MTSRGSSECGSPRACPISWAAVSSIWRASSGPREEGFASASRNEVTSSVALPPSWVQRVLVNPNWFLGGLSIQSTVKSAGVPRSLLSTRIANGCPSHARTPRMAACCISRATLGSPGGRGTRMRITRVVSFHRKARAVPSFHSNPRHRYAESRHAAASSRVTTGAPMVPVTVPPGAQVPSC